MTGHRDGGHKSHRKRRIDLGCDAPKLKKPGGGEVIGELASTLLFTARGVHTLNGRPLGDIPDRQFAELMLATFIGPEPPTPRLKRELLGLRD
jgi:hypothetical protein